MLDLLALVRLKAISKSDFDIPEAFFDLGYAGHYFWRIKSLNINIPWIVSTFTSVDTKLSLIKTYIKSI